MLEAPRTVSDGERSGESHRRFASQRKRGGVLREKRAPLYLFWLKTQYIHETIKQNERSNYISSRVQRAHLQTSATQSAHPDSRRTLLFPMAQNKHSAMRDAGGHCTHHRVPEVQENFALSVQLDAGQAGAPHMCPRHQRPLPAPGKCTQHTGWGVRCAGHSPSLWVRG